MLIYAHSFRYNFILYLDVNVPISIQYGPWPIGFTFIFNTAFDTKYFGDNNLVWWFWALSMPWYMLDSIDKYCPKFPTFKWVITNAYDIKNMNVANNFELLITRRTL